MLLTSKIAGHASRCDLRAIGRFSVRFRWPILPIWIAGAIAASTQLPAPVEVSRRATTRSSCGECAGSQAADLAAPFGTANKQPIPVIVATTSGKLTAADAAAISGLEARLAAAPDIAKVV